MGPTSSSSACSCITVYCLTQIKSTSSVISLSPSLPPSLPLQRWGVFSHSFPARCACLFIKGKVSTIKFDAFL